MANNQLCNEHELLILEPGAVSQRSHQAPQSMRWALRQPSAPTPSNPRATAGTTATNPPTSSGLIYIDPVNLRRSNAAALNGALNSAVQTAAVAAAASQQAADESANSQTTSCTANNLSRAFGIILRQVADLINAIKDYRASAPNLARVLDYTQRDVQQLQVCGRVNIIDIISQILCF